MTDQKKPWCIVLLHHHLFPLNCSKPFLGVICLNAPLGFTVKPLLEDPPMKGQCINYLYTKDILKNLNLFTFTTS